MGNKLHTMQFNSFLGALNNLYISQHLEQCFLAFFSNQEGKRDNEPA